MNDPRLDAANLVRRVKDHAALLDLPAAAQEAVRVLMTSAMRGCNARVAAPLPGLKLVVSQGAGQAKLGLATLAACGVRVQWARR